MSEEAAFGTMVICMVLFMGFIIGTGVWAKSNQTTEVLENGCVVTVKWHGGTGKVVCPIVVKE